MPVITISDELARELLQWCEVEREFWPPDTPYQSDLRALADYLISERSLEEDEGRDEGSHGGPQGDPTEPSSAL